MYRYIIYSYFLIALLSTAQIVISVKPKRRVITSIITFWFMVTPVVNSRMFRLINPIIKITGRAWRFDFQLSLLLIFIITSRFLLVKNSRLLYSKPMLRYEKYLYTYFYLSMGIYYLHYLMGNLMPEYLGVRLYINYAALLLYFSLVRFLDEDTIKCLFKAMIVMGIVSAFYTFPQFFVDKWIMRTDRMAFAFGEHRRSSGIFATPHDHAIFSGAVLYLIYFTVKNIRLKLILISFIGMGIILTFSRSSWMGVFLTGCLYFVTYHKDLLKKRVFQIAFVTLIGFLLYSTYFPEIKDTIKKTEVVEQRLASDTATQRFGLWHIGIGVLSENWVIGLGDKVNNPVYYKLMYAIGGKDWALGLGGGVHNLLIEELVYKGLFSALSLLFFIIFLIKYCYTFNNKPNIIYLVAMYYVISYFVFQQFAASFVNAYIGILVVIFAAIVSSVNYNNLDISGFALDDSFFGRKIGDNLDKEISK
jgi:O-antigen ligase